MIQDLYTLVHKQLVNELTEQEQSLLDQLLLDPANKSLQKQISESWEKSLHLENQNFNSTAAYGNFVKVVSKKPILPKYLILTAVFIVALLLSFYIFSDKFLTHSFEDGEIIELADGSTIYLDKNSSIEYYKQFNVNRELVLNGSALFDVSKIKGSPFTIQSGDVNITVLGTTFSVSNTNNTNEVQVIEGAVRVEANNDDIVLNARESVSFDDGQQMIISNNVDLDKLTFYSPIMSYDQVSLIKVLGDIEVYYKIKFDIQGTVDLKGCTFSSGSLLNTPLNEIFEILETSYSAIINPKAEGLYSFSAQPCQ